MLDKLVAFEMNPKTVRMIKIGAITVGVLAGAVVTGYILYKAGLIGEASETVDDVLEVATSTPTA